MRYFYTFFLYLITPLILLRLFLKSLKNPDYSKRISERFGFVNLNNADIWIHAVSLGEVVAVTPLVNELLAKKFKILITTMTPTGSRQVNMKFGDKVQHCYLPYDLPVVLNKFFRQVKVKMVLILETEIWPNLIYTAKKNKCNLFLINGRISDKSVKYYTKFRFFFKHCLKYFDHIFAQSELDRKRFIDIGADNKNISVFGNLKFDSDITIGNKDLLPLKHKWGASRVVLILASTHEDEEEQFLDKLKLLQQSIPQLLLIIVPRHPERFNTVYDLSVQKGFTTTLRSEEQSINKDVEVLVVNTLGELGHFYELTNYAFVGGSLVPVGGHNVLEPIAFNVPVFTGPFMNNSREIVDELLREGAIKVTKDINDLVVNILALHKSEQEFKNIISNGAMVLAKNRGGVKRYLAQIERVF